MLFQKYGLYRESDTNRSNTSDEREKKELRTLMWMVRLSLLKLLLVFFSLLRFHIKLIRANERS